jgi:hypothetical protein
MKRILLAGAAALAPTLAAAQDFVIAPAVQSQFRTYVIEGRVPSVVVQQPVVIGAPLPPAVALRPVPPVIVQQAPVYADYQYAYVGDRIVLVEPATRRVVHVLQ